MSDQERIDKLSKDLQRLVNEQRRFVEEIRTIKRQLDQLQSKVGRTESGPEDHDTVLSTSVPTGQEVKTRILTSTSEKIPAEKNRGLFARIDDIRSTGSRDFEKFIGENLINKIGILITILGVGIGAKYSIDNNLISPQLRIILGYLVGLLLLGTGIKLKSKYLNYSAVLTSGALAIFYFITYFAFSFYQLIPQSLAYGLMTLFTIFGVVAAINYNQQVIALIGLTGAYAIPFLIGGDSENATPLFLYITIINAGILIIAIRKYWHLVHYSAFLFTWLIFAFWYHASFDYSNDITSGLIFSTLFYLLFYATFIVNKIIQKLPFNRLDVVLILSNSFIYFGYGYAMIMDAPGENNYLGLFTIANALVHFAVSTIIYYQKLADRNLFYFVSGLVLVFLTIAIPVQLTGSWITLLWAGEALILFWIGHTRKIPFYKKLSYPLIFLAFISQSIEWSNTANLYSYYDSAESFITPILRVEFFTTLLYMILLGGINYLAFINPGADQHAKKGLITQLIAISIGGLFLFVVFTTFRIEIQLYWKMLFVQSQLEITQNNEVSTINNYNLRSLEYVWLINYGLIFCSILSAVVLRWVKHNAVIKTIIALNIFALIIFLFDGIGANTELRSNYILQPNGEYYEINAGQLAIRYISYLLIAIVWYLSLKLADRTKSIKDYSWLMQLGIHGSILWILSSELIHWLDLSNSAQSDKLGLSILWGVYALILIALGIWKKQKYIRVAAIVLFLATLLKLFTYDLTSLSTVGKTIVFVSLGVLLLIISFLYNKYKYLIANEGKID